MKYVCCSKQDQDLLRGVLFGVGVQGGLDSPRTIKHKDLSSLLSDQGELLSAANPEFESFLRECILPEFFGDKRRTGGKIDPKKVGKTLLVYAFPDYAFSVHRLQGSMEDVYEKIARALETSKRGMCHPPYRK